MLGVRSHELGGAGFTLVLLSSVACNSGTNKIEEYAELSVWCKKKNICVTKQPLTNNRENQRARTAAGDVV